MGACDRLTLFAAIVAGSGAMACSQAPPPQTAAAVPVPAVSPAAPSPVTLTPPATRRPESPPPPRPVEPVVVEEGGGVEEEPSLARAAASERQRRQVATQSSVVVTDKNLSEHAVGKLTYANTPAVDATADQDSGVSSAERELADEAHWRERMRTLRLEWSRSVDAIIEFEGRVAGLRTRFYAEDDPYVRDGQIKPAWDHAIEGLEKARVNAAENELAVGRALAEGARAGVMPGWLREGIDLEPTGRPYKLPNEERADTDDEYVVGEPSIVDEGGGT